MTELGGINLIFLWNSLHTIWYNLTGADFSGSDLQRAVFRQSILEKADFREAYNFSIDPELNKMKKARFSRIGLSGLLDKYEINIS